MITSEDQLQNWVADKFRGQFIKRTLEPYMNHLNAVASMAKQSTEHGYEIGLCHDLLEDTETTARELIAALLSFGYSQFSASLISTCVVELTDVFTKAAYPKMKKKLRKKVESLRLLTISPVAQTVKYADLIYNAEWIIKYDSKHAQKYLRKKKRLLAAMTKGDSFLHEQAVNVMKTGLRTYAI
ncbi:hypothetical protein OQY15_00970 [Pedobacter sp. MC2016-15]|uniref:hypothetical protein n=1 Tax=Pedobacter sp. MC2016-15 TaxID=2994473 RepID=UPI00224821E3|nr:hypothetical protein [Pedobacter sp. MC2016-15]MCX2477639.1 hypothetical protein [Pedobacter sp. MC2016-15]